MEIFFFFSGLSFPKLKCKKPAGRVFSTVEGVQLSEEFDFTLLSFLHFDSPLIFQGEVISAGISRAREGLQRCSTRPGG